MQILPDGTVLPDYYSSYVPGTEPSGADDNFGLFVGEVQKIIYPGDKDAQPDQKFVEYEVMVERLDPYSDNVTHPPLRCTLINSFGGVADRFHYTLRGDEALARDKSDQQNKTYGLGYGSKVLVLCVQGKRHAGIIIGGIRDQQDEKDTKLGHNLQFTFNGVSVTINNDGELTIVHRGPTKADGKPQNENDPGSGSVVRMDKNGGFMVLTPSGGTLSFSEAEGKKGFKVLSGGNWVTLDDAGISAGDKSGENTITMGSDGVQLIAKAVNVFSETTSINSGSVLVGDGADSAMVRGDQLVAWLQDLVNTLTSAQTIPAVPGSPLTFQPSVIAQLGVALGTLRPNVLSKNCKVK